MSLFRRDTKARALQDQNDRLTVRNKELLERLKNEVEAHHADNKHHAAVLASVKENHIRRVEELEALLESATKDAEQSARLAAAERLISQSRAVNARKWFEHVQHCPAAQAVQEEDEAKAADR